MTLADPKDLAGLVEACHEAARERLVVSTSGNFSLRLGRDDFAITGSGVRLGTAHRRDIVMVGLDGEPRARRGGPRASIETPLHLAVYAARPDAGAVLHCQSPFATVLASRREAHVDLNLIPEFPAYVGGFAVVEFFLPGTVELARAVAAACEDPEVRVVLLRQHGQLVIGSTPAKVVQAAAFFELAASIWVRGGGSEGALESLSPESIAALEGYGAGPARDPAESGDSE